MGKTGGVAETLTAPAKLTRTLRITGVRADGYHLIDAEMVTIDLADTMLVEESAAGLTLLVVRGVPIPDSERIEENLVVRALQAVDRSAAVTLTKRIPSGAGLGGGSADAAAILRWAGCTDVDLALELGADVPFCVLGGRARVRGVGEQVDPLPFDDVAGLVVTLLTPPLHVSTPAVYQAWDALGGLSGAGPNDLEPAALVVAPDLVRWRDALADATGVAPTLAGSGATWFVEGAFAHLVVDGIRAVVARTTPPAA